MHVAIRPKLRLLASGSVLEERMGGWRDLAKSPGWGSERAAFGKR
jgi:hypothetical protein